jgi:hypothetical protein
VSKREGKPGDRFKMPFDAEVAIQTLGDSRPSAHICYDVKICELIQAEIGTETFWRVTKIVEGVPAVSVQRFRRIFEISDLPSKGENKPGDRFEVPFKHQLTISTGPITAHRPIYLATSKSDSRQTRTSGLKHSDQGINVLTRFQRFSFNGSGGYPKIQIYHQKGKVNRGIALKCHSPPKSAYKHWPTAAHRPIYLPMSKSVS